MTNTNNNTNTPHTQDTTRPTTARPTTARPQSSPHTHTWTAQATIQLVSSGEVGTVQVAWLGMTVLACIHSASGVVSMYDVLTEEQQQLNTGRWLLLLYCMCMCCM